MNTKICRRIAVINTLVAFAGLGLLSSVTHAEDRAPASALANKVVSYGDLNLSHSAALEQLYHRIAAAARQVCGGNENLRAVGDKMRLQICVESSIARAVASVDQPALTSLYAAKSGRATPSVVLAQRQ